MIDVVGLNKFLGGAGGPGEYLDDGGGNEEGDEEQQTEQVGTGTGG